MGDNNISYFLESCAIGIGSPDHNTNKIDLSYPITKNSHTECLSPLNDSSLFGIEDDSDLSQNFNDYEDKFFFPDSSPRYVSHAKKTGMAARCELRNGEITCSGNTDSSFLVLRFHEGIALPVTRVSVSVKGESIEVQAGDLLIAMNSTICPAIQQEDIIFVVQNVVKSGNETAQSVSPQRIANEIADFVATKAEHPVNKTTKVSSISLNM